MNLAGLISSIYSMVGNCMKFGQTILNKTGLLLLGMVILLAAGSMAVAGSDMPSFSLSSAVDGKTVNSDDFKGKTLLVTFFATWCPPCRQEIPNLIKLQQEYADKGFSVIGLSLDEKGPSIVARLVDKEKINYPVLMADSRTAREFGGIAGIPTSFLVNKKGQVVKRYPGYVPHTLLEKDIKSVL